jgi:hypothetical protein
MDYLADIQLRTDREAKGATDVRWLFQSYGLDPVNVAFKVVKRHEGFSVIVHFLDGQFHLSYYHFMQDSLEFLHGKKVALKPELEDLDFEAYDVMFWELKMTVNDELVMPPKGKSLGELVAVFNEKKKLKGVFEGVDCGYKHFGYDGK